MHVDDSEVPWLVVWLRERFSTKQRARLIRQAFLHPGAAPCKSAAPLIESRVGLEMQPRDWSQEENSNPTSRGYIDSVEHASECGDRTIEPVCTTTTR